MENLSTVSTEYISVSANRFPEAASISPSGNLVAFGSSHLLALWNLQTSPDPGVYITLAAHGSTISCVGFLDDNCFISGDEEGKIFLWHLENDKWKFTRLNAHSKSITALTIHTEARILVTGSSDATSKVWSFDSNEELQSLSLGGKYPLAMAVSQLPKSKSLILAIGATDTKIQIWVRANAADCKFFHAASLSGHEDWIRCLAFQEQDDSLVLASGSHDSNIRLWNIEPFTHADASGDALLDAFEATLGQVTEDEGGGKQVSMKRHIVTVRSTRSSQQYSITFDALLVGHEAGVTSLQWRTSSASDKPSLLSSSTDSSVIIWSPATIMSGNQDESTAIWINVQRFGDVGGQRLGGFIGALWAGHGEEVLAWGWSGGWRRWKSSGRTTGTPERWAEVHAISGHSGPVKSLSWSPNGKFLVTTGLDQSTRIHAPLFKDGRTTWHEIARPQVHGFDLLAAGFLSDLKMVSIGDEKVARVFEAPKSFVDVVTSLHIATFDESEAQNRPMTATVPALGLSNRANNEDGASELSQVLVSDRPLEGELAATTLWPEVEKIFGHGYESISLAISNKRDLIASACKTTSPEHALVRLWDTQTWRPVGDPLAGHSLTVTRVAFSPDDKYVLSVSRDRTWRLFERDIHTGGYKPIAADKSHGRIIWDCSWAREGDVFATASRDKTVRIWKSTEDGARWTATTIQLPEAATAVDFCERRGDKRMLAVGLEVGEILVYTSQVSDPTVWVNTLKIPSGTAHIAQINCLSWRQSEKDEDKLLASCSDDGSLRILKITCL
ncbi:WD40 repeat-like protein [Cylindrobasidium torrendii FP15055 ss-10]|uniref:Elongator complex protein 2 n=1 Tax=Cylindrobasidium torrendii FP15055 ss-10 TaxID=1314674 RepID=A0A0D7BTI7_9AGAR|nr:WD40 repeat-like protein [Cylindrobasidium torrendii FP15055 ss-10]